MVRTSTDKQSIEDQHNEMVEFLASEGYKENEIEWVEEQGASAAKVDEPYKAMIAKIKDIITGNENIKALAVWHLNRAFRTEDSYVSLKGFLVSHKVNLICKNPYLKLLTPQGQVDKGMELAAGLLAILAKQDQDERKEKFARAKKANAAKGKYNGGTPKFGYRVDENGFVVPDEDQAAIVNQIYELYATGKYSGQTLAKELSDLGVTRNGKTIDPETLIRMLSDTAYIGYTDSDRNRSHRKFVPIITKELWDKVEEVRLNNYKSIPRTGRVYLANKIIKCPICGSNLHIDGTHYQCWRHNSHSKPARSGNRCEYSLYPPASPTHTILWSIASQMHVQHLLQMGRNDVSSYKDKLATIEKKLETLQGKVNALERRKSKVVDSYIDELIDKAQRDEKLAKIASDTNELNLKIKTLKSDHGKIQKLIKQLSDVDTYTGYVSDTMLGVLRERDLHKMYEIIHTYVLSCTVTRTQFGPADPRSSRPNALEYHVKTVDGYTYKFLYLPCSQKEFKYFGWDGRKWSPVMMEPID